MTDRGRPSKKPQPPPATAAEIVEALEAAAASAHHPACPAKPYAPPTRACECHVGKARRVLPTARRLAEVYN